MRHFLRIACVVCSLGWGAFAAAAMPELPTLRQPSEIPATPLSSSNSYDELKESAAQVVSGYTDSSSGKQIKQREIQDKAADANPYAISLYKPTYVLPTYYTFNPYNRLYRENTPNHQNLDHTEVKFQISFKVPVWHQLFKRPGSNLYIAYTQLAYWQAYNKSAFFRETNFEPELLAINSVDYPLLWGWSVKQINPAMVHQSNGRGGSMERSWNRITLENVFQRGNWIINWKPWYVLRDSQVKTYNDDITKYLGHARLLITYKYKRQVFTLMSRNNIESGFGRGAYQFRWLFPLTKRLNGYIQMFTGFGQSLAEYNHRTKAIGIGVALTEWV